MTSSFKSCNKYNRKSSYDTRFARIVIMRPPRNDPLTFAGKQTNYRPEVDRLLY